MVFPHRVNIPNVGEPSDGEEIIHRHLHAWWCWRNLKRDDWLHDIDGFKFRNEEDAVLFKLVWG